MIINEINLEEEFLKMYVERATPEQLKNIDMLLEQGDYEQIAKIIEEYKNSIINNEDLKNTNNGNPSDGEMPLRIRTKKEFSTEKMEPQTIELLGILKLIDEYEKETDPVKKALLLEQIQKALIKYRTPEEKTLEEETTEKTM